MKLLIKLYIVFTSLLVVPWSYAQYDLNGNDTIDLPLTLVDGNQLRWFGQDLTTDEVFQMGLFGHPDYQIGIGYWILNDKVNRVYVRKNEFGDFELYADNKSDGYNLGQSHDNAVVIIDRDIDSSGLLDAALINGERRKWAWKFSLDPLSGSSSKRRILYGSKKHIPFLFRARGNTDSLGILKVRGKRSKISYRTLLGRKNRQIRVRGLVPPKEQPQLIRDSKGRDYFGFVKNNKVVSVNRRGRKDKIETSVPKNGSILIGNFDDVTGDEIVFFSEGKIVFADGQTKRLSDENVKPLSNKASKYKNEDISPTIVPTKTPTVTPVNTAIPTISPTVTPTLTATPTATQTFTPLPTWTLQPTFTPFPTFTMTPTYTSTSTPKPKEFISIWKTNNTGGVSGNNQITLPLESDGTYAFDVDWGDDTSDLITSWNQTEVTHTYVSAGTYTVKIDGTIVGFRFNNGGDKTKIVDISNWGILKLGNNGDYFSGCSNLDSSATDNVDLRGTTSLARMFRDASNFNGNIGSWNTSLITDMNNLFYGASKFNQDIGNWDTTNVINMGSMFRDASSFNQDIGNWSISSVGNIWSMFRGASSFNQDISRWNTSNLNSMDYMFNGASNFNQNLSGWCVASKMGEPTLFDDGANSWTNDPAWRPQWGTCPGTPTPTATPTP